jgi:DNA helicase-2/ATP-dependent DNA helicase PcrA
VDAWIDIRRKARACHEEALKTSKGDRRANKLVAAALQNDDLELRHYEPGSIVSAGVLGFLNRTARLVNVAKHQDPADELVVISHEIGHYRLHRDPQSEVTVRPHGLGGDPIDSGAGRVEGYSPRERKEVQADIFAGEFLCPADRLRDEYISRDRRPHEIAKELGLPLHLVINQIIRALLLPPIGPAEPPAAAQQHVLDASQEAAATWRDGPLLVDAGPGTGKTRTLIRRIKYLLEKGAVSGSILALTFSIKASEEMRERLSAMDAAAAIEMWVGTFHSFGLELVTKWPSRVGRTAKVRILDQTGSLGILEDNLAKLPLRYYQNLYEPAYELVHVLRAISRCKDELISPAAYRAEAEAALAAAGTDDARVDAERAIEVAAIYEIYEQELQEANAVDFGDLIVLATRLLEEHAEVRAYVHARFKHVLVDEYQDVNLASARLLRAVCGAGTDVWVVADQRQSIYRFRGAEPSNVARFEQEFGGTRRALGNNYRSVAQVVRTFATFSSVMGGGAMAGRWAADRKVAGEVSLVVAPNLTAEAEAISERINTLQARGVPYREQVILGRSHLTLARITGILEQLGIPLIYLGDLFERPEIRDLLSLVALDAEYGGVGLVRVAALPPYQVQRDDALAVIRWAQAQRITIFETLKRATEIDGVSEAGRAGLVRLGAELDGLGPGTSPWTLLTTWLFERSDYLRAWLTANDTASKQKLVAIYQLLKVCGEQVALGDSSRRRFLDRVRRIEALNEDAIYRAVASEAADMDAVRVMTIHGSKGLEFRAVHLPALATRNMPTNRQAIWCPPPPSLAQLAMQPQHHEAEEECLFFVALSRARDHLSLSRAERYTAVNASASRFLGPIAGIVRTSRYEGSGQVSAESTDLLPPAPRERYEERELTLYRFCPARYRYEFIDGLHGIRDDSTYIRFHRCVYVTIGWLQEQRAQGKPFDLDAAHGRLAEEWTARGPVGHAFESHYRSTAEGMVAAMASAIAGETGTYDRQEWAIPVNGKLVVIRPDRVVIVPTGAIRVQRVRTGRKTKSEPDNPIYALLRRGAAARYPGKPVSIESFYLATGEVVPVEQRNDDKAIEQYAEAIDGIERGDFHPIPDPRRCPNCQCYFMCGA